MIKNLQQCYISNTESSCRSVGLLEFSHCETGIALGMLSLSHISLYICLTMSLIQTLFQLRDDLKYIFKSTRARITSLICE